MNVSIQFDAHRAFSALDALSDPDMASRATKVAAQTYHDDILDWIDAGRSFKSRTGSLEQSIGWMSQGDTSVVYANSEIAPYLEFGTGTHGPKAQPYWIRPKAGRKALRWHGEGGAEIVRRAVQHPGIEAMPYFFADQTAREDRIREAVMADLAGRL